MFIQVHEVTTREEREAIYRFRYWIYAVELGKQLPGMDHVRGTYSDELDDGGVLLAAVDQDTGHLVGTSCATRISRCGVSDRLVQQLDLGPMCDLFGEDAISISGGFMVDPVYRGRTVASLLAGTQYQLGLDTGTRVSVLLCELGLLRLYYQVGYRPYTSPLHPHDSAGLRMPLALTLHDRGHLQRRSSPLLGLLPAAQDDRGATAQSLANAYTAFSDVPTEPMEKRALWAAIAHSAPAEQDANVFTGFDKGEIGYFLDRFAVLALPQGEHFYRVGKRAKGLAVVLNGQLGVTLQSGDDPHFLGVLRPGDVVGEVAGVLEGGRSETVVALQDSQVLLLPEDIHEHLERRDVTLAYRFSRNLARLLGARLQAVNQTLAGFGETSPATLSSPTPPTSDRPVETADSYDPDAIDDRRAEIDRLEQQAERAWTLEHYWLRKVGWRGRGTVVDLGSGPGVIARQMARSFPSCTVIGVEPDDELRQRAVQRAQEAGLEDRCTFVAGVADALPLDDHSVDACYARFLFQHQSDPLDVLKELRRVLRPGGQLVIADVDDEAVVIHPTPDGLKDLQHRAAEAQHMLGGDRFIGRKLVDYLGRAGFESPRTRVAPLTSHHVALQAMIDAMFGFKAQTLRRAGLLEPDDEALLARLSQLSLRAGAWVLAPLFFALAAAPIDRPEDD